jgi:hypothetical protein
VIDIQDIEEDTVYSIHYLQLKKRIEERQCCEEIIVNGIEGSKCWN